MSKCYLITHAANCNCSLDKNTNRIYLLMLSQINTYGIRTDVSRWIISGCHTHTFNEITALHKSRDHLVPAHTHTAHPRQSPPCPVRSPPLFPSEHYQFTTRAPIFQWDRGQSWRHESAAMVTYVITTQSVPWLGSWLDAFCRRWGSWAGSDAYDIIINALHAQKRLVYDYSCVQCSISHSFSQRSVTQGS